MNSRRLFSACRRSCALVAIAGRAGSLHAVRLKNPVQVEAITFGGGACCASQQISRPDVSDGSIVPRALRLLPERTCRWTEGLRKVRAHEVQLFELNVAPPSDRVSR